MQELRSHIMYKKKKSVDFDLLPEMAPQLGMCNADSAPAAITNSLLCFGGVSLRELDGATPGLDALPRPAVW